MAKLLFGILVSLLLGDYCISMLLGGYTEKDKDGEGIPEIAKFAFGYLSKKLNSKYGFQKMELVKAETQVKKNGEF